MKTILLIGRTRDVIDDVIEQFATPDLRLLAADDVAEVTRALAAHHVDQVIIGGGLDLDRRLAIVQAVFLASDHTTVHMNSPSGPASFLPFVRAVIAGLR